MLNGRNADCPNYHCRRFLIRMHWIESHWRLNWNDGQNFANRMYSVDWWAAHRCLVADEEMSMNRKRVIFLLSCRDASWWGVFSVLQKDRSNNSWPRSVAAPSSMLVLVDLRADFLLSLFSFPLPPLLAIHIAACPSHIHWPCPGSAVLVFGPVVVERYTPTWHQTAALCPSLHSASICPSSVEGRAVEVKGASCHVTSSRSHGARSVTESKFVHWCLWRDWKP